MGAVLCALSAPSVRLRCTFPLIGNSFSSESSIPRGLSSSDNNGLPMMTVSDAHYYPILVEQMSYKSQVSIVVLLVIFFCEIQIFIYKVEISFWNIDFLNYTISDRSWQFPYFLAVEWCVTVLAWFSVATRCEKSM